MMQSMHSFAIVKLCNTLTEPECYDTPRDSLHKIRRTFRKIMQDEVSLATLWVANQCKSDLMDKALLYKSVVCDKTDDGIKDRLFLSGQ